MNCFLGISNSLEKISRLFHSIIFLFLFIDHWGRLYLSLLFFGTLHSNGYIFPFSLAFRFSSIHNFCKASSDTHFAFLYFFFLGMVLIPASCTMSRCSVHSSSGTLSIRSNPLNLFQCRQSRFGSFKCFWIFKSLEVTLMLQSKKGSRRKGNMVII